MLCVPLCITEPAISLYLLYCIGLHVVSVKHRWANLGGALYAWKWWDHTPFIHLWSALQNKLFISRTCWPIEVKGMNRTDISLSELIFQVVRASQNWAFWTVLCRESQIWALAYPIIIISNFYLLYCLSNNIFLSIISMHMSMSLEMGRIISKNE